MYDFITICIYRYILSLSEKLPGCFFQVFEIYFLLVKNWKTETTDVCLLAFEMSALWKKACKTLRRRTSETLVNSWGGGPAKHLSNIRQRGQPINRTTKYNLLLFVYKFTSVLECDSVSLFWGAAGVFRKVLNNSRPLF